MGNKRHILSIYNAMKSLDVGSCGGSSSKEETALNPKVKEKKTKAENSPKVEIKISDGALKNTWWKKRLARSYASKIDRKSNTTSYGMT
ncbi:hypothetical protein SASPL_111846 [Salvia splendens]|uniref:Uncharacterized protein n=1 Tax=Salvia splendens TaxID=180675 RepID=A0A8X8Y8V5_SALSN|nr:hypothetical protein SASPL_111846 [Salvia splendens]